MIVYVIKFYDSRPNIIKTNASTGSNILYSILIYV